MSKGPVDGARQWLGIEVLAGLFSAERRLDAGWGLRCVHGTRLSASQQGNQLARMWTQGTRAKHEICRRQTVGLCIGR